MSNALVEPCSPSSQLYFHFDHPENALDHVGLVPQVEPSTEPPMHATIDCLERRGAPTPNHPMPNHPMPTHPMPNQALQSVQRPSRARSERLGKPVRLGGVMLELLRRYGITEEEIAQGLQAAVD